MNPVFNDIHVSQHPSSYNEDARPNNYNCGPTCVLMALRLFERELHGITDVPVNDGIRAIRKAVSGLGDERSFTYLDWFIPLLRAAGIDCMPCHGENTPLDVVHRGGALILRGEGKQANTWYCDYPDEDHITRAGYHFVLVSGVAPADYVQVDNEIGGYIVNDPLSNIGPIVVSEAELRTFATVDDCNYDSIMLFPDSEN